MSRKADTTNFLLLLILIVLLVGFGFLTPIFGFLTLILWIIGILTAILLLSIVLGYIFNAIGYELEGIVSTIHKITDPVTDQLYLFINSDIGHWLLIGALAAMLLWLYLLTEDEQVLYAFLIPGMLAFFKFISFLDTLSIKRKYNKFK